jgi:molybdate transport system regulatory protein
MCGLVSQRCAGAEGGEFVARNIVVSAAGRKLGKTAIACALVSALVKDGLTASYYKLRSRPQNETVYSPGPGAENSDTWRLHASGALETILVDRGSNGIDGIVTEGSPVDATIWETNSALAMIPNPFLIYIQGETDTPKNPELAHIADVVLDGPVHHLSHDTASMILSSAGFESLDPVRPAWKLWLELESGPVFGKGIAVLLEAVRDSGSILAASRAAGIQYRQVWTLISRAEMKLGLRLVQRSRGGTGGGGSRLTPVALMLLRRYHCLENALIKASCLMEE